MSQDPARNRVLKAKYLDWCSARLADRFLQLPPEAIYELALEASREDARPLDEEGLTMSSYRALVERVTDALADRIGLPSFEQWAAAYEVAPETFDAELLGLWKEWQEEVPA